MALTIPKHLIAGVFERHGNSSSVQVTLSVPDNRYL